MQKNILFQLRKKQGLTQDEMAEKLFVTRQAVSRWENGETIPNIDTLKIMSKIFDVSIGTLLGLEGDKLCLFKQGAFTFSYRVAGILISDGRILLQKPHHTDEYAFPGGLVIFGEKTSDALIRRWREEMGLAIDVGALKWVEEVLFLMDGKPCQQICLYYIVSIQYGEDITDGMPAYTYSHDDKEAVCFYWVPLEKVKNFMVYPSEAAELLQRLDEPLEHLTYWEDCAKT